MLEIVKKNKTCQKFIYTIRTLYRRIFSIIQFIERFVIAFSTLLKKLEPREVQQNFLSHEWNIQVNVMFS